MSLDVFTGSNEKQVEQFIFWSTYRTCEAKIARGSYNMKDVHYIVSHIAETRHKFPALTIGRAAGAPAIDEACSWIPAL